MSGVTGRLARWVANRETVPTAQRAVLGYYAETGTFDYQALDLKSRVDDEMENILSDLYTDLEAALAQEFSVSSVSFEYETKLTLPAELTLGYLFRRALSNAEGEYDPVADESPGSGGLRSVLPRLGGRRDSAVARQTVNREAAAYADDARDVTELIVAALLDGDMRDAINDDEFEDFVVDLDVAAEERRRVAEVAQRCLQERVEAGFEEYPDAFEAAYDHAVDVSEAHQDQDERFRELMAAADGAGEHDLTTAEAREAIEREYKYRSMADDQHPFTEEELSLAYLTTQYDRVGVIYHGMLEMYRAAGFEIEPAFERSIVFAIIGAQIWLDDVDDYRDDVDDGQLTPVTAEYLLCDDDRTAFENVVSLSETYFDHARSYATEADSTLTGLAVEYILRTGDVSHLPGSNSN